MQGVVFGEGGFPDPSYLFKFLPQWQLHRPLPGLKQVLIC